MMESYDVSLFDIGFRIIVETLARYGVDITWAEKDRKKAMAAWQHWQQLSEEDYSEIAHLLLANIEPHLRAALAVTLDANQPREVREVEVTIETNLGESRRYTFTSVSEALDFLADFNEQVILNDENGPAIWDIENMGNSDING